MFAFLLCIPLSRSEELNCQLKQDTANEYPKNGTIVLTCDQITSETGEAIKAKLGDFTLNKTEYTFDGWNADTTEFQLSFPNVDKVYNNVTVAVIPAGDTEISKYSVVNVTILSDPVIGAPQKTDSIETVYPNSQLTFSVNITNTIITDSSKIKYEIYEATTDKTTFTDDSPSEASLTRVGDSDKCSFNVTIPDNTPAGAYKLIVQFTDSQHQNSELKSTVTSFEVNDPSIQCNVIEGLTNYTVNSTQVQANCTINGFSSTTFKARVGDDDSRPYSYNCQYNAENHTVTCDFTENSQETNKVNFGLMSDQNIPLANQSCDINLIPVPEASNLDFVNSSETITKGQSYQFKVSVTKPTMTEFTGIAAFVASTEQDFTEGTAVTLSKTGQPNEYNFSFTIPEGSSVGTHNLLFKAINVLNESSTAVKKEITIPEPAVSMECSALETKDFELASNAVKAKCIISGNDSPTIRAKTGNVTNTQADYKYPCSYNSSDLTVSCDFSKDTPNDAEANKVSFAIIGNEAILANSSVDLNLIPSPNANNLDFSETQPTTIYPGDILSFKVTVDAPTKTSVTAKIEFADQSASQLTDQAQTVELTKTGNEYKFNFQVPANASEATHKLLFQATNIINQTSSVLTKDVTVKIKPTLKCTNPTNPNLKASGSLVISCNTSENIKTKAFKYSFDKTSFNDATFNEGNVSFTYTAQTTPVTQIIIAVFDDSTQLVNTTVIATILPAPSINKIADANKGSKYIVGDDISVKITTETFYLFEDAKILYGFDSSNETQLNGGIEAKSAPKKISDTEYQITIKVPDTENTEGSKYLKMKFIDKAGQETTATTKDKIEFYQTVFMEKPKIGSAEQGSVSESEEPKFKTTDTIRVELTLKNLKSKDNTKFGFKLGNKDGEMHDITSYEIIEESSSQRRLLETTYKAILNITIPDDYKVPKDGKTELLIYTLDKDNHIVSAPVEQKIILEKDNQEQPINPQNNTPNKGPSYETQDDNKLGGKALAAIITVVIVIIVIMIIAIIFFLKKGKKNAPSDSGSGIAI